MQFAPELQVSSIGFINGSTRVALNIIRCQMTQDAFLGIEHVAALTGQARC
jgi:hypothetical protein